MENHVYKKIEIVGTSDTGIEDAISHGVERAAATLHNLDWFEVSEIRGAVRGGKVAQYQVVMKVGFRLED
ncbi:dodecin domain-containing protein [Azospirillum sp. RWY-5-1]|uniref:Dodecin domain-containing protein n=1 Tax=Azospirillum oleiclasticum TaxID=2735135 RepID=A0ABX2TF38_9PROT|nr:dodecin [Azospirillum oleiclasticum]NYZ15274.1 dodecin domain-containing protein [Azospirillum oleiclasticum]NYZ21305.1 dodecin domain-containing protein [Azospirillum oleiclasticum]